MASIINDPPFPPLDVEADFFFKQDGPTGSVTYDGDTYPYEPLYEGDTRYLLNTTPVHLPVVFEAEFNPAHPKRPYVRTPPGVTILEYHWTFGDGTEGFGPTVTHTFEVVDPNIEVTLTVIDSRNQRWSVARPVNLVYEAFGFVSPYVIRGENTEEPPVKSVAETSDGALADDGPATPEWIHRGGKRVRDVNDAALAHDAASGTTHAQRRTSDVALASDVATRTTHLHRGSTGEEATTVDAAPTRQVHRRRTVEDTAATTDVASP